jgi:tripartite-type tricarboxylate transporter receptor subunit TctC
MISKRALGQGLLAISMVASCGFCSAHAQDSFYKGKNLDLVIGYPPGGSNDLYARLLGAHFSKHIPGNPTIVTRNMPGAGSFVAVNYMMASAPKDGSAVAIGAPTLAIDEKLGTSGVRYKTAELNWIGRVAPLVNIVMIKKTSPVKTIEDALKQEVTLSGTGAGSTAVIYPTVMNNMFGTKFKLVNGYKGSNEAMLAVERGEVDGHSTAWEALKTAHPTWVPDGYVVLPVQFSTKRIAELPNVPTAVEFARNDEEKRILEAIVSAAEVGTSFFTTPGVPPARVQLLRRAFDATMDDPDFKADVAKVRVSFDPMKGEDLQKLVAQVSNLPPDLTEKVRKVYQQN